MYLIIDGTLIHDREELHDLLSRELRLPEWYGRNLDALHDCLTGRRQPVDIILLREETLMENLGMYGAMFRKVLLDSARENPVIGVFAAAALI